MICPNCTTDNPAGAQFCGGCGNALASGPAGEPTTQLPTSPPAAIPPIPASPPLAPPGATDPTSMFPAAPPPPGPPGTPPPAAAPGAPIEKKSRKSLLLGLLALLVVAAAVGSFLVLGGDDEGGDASEAIVLEPIGLSLRDDFAGDLDLRSFDSSIARLLPDVPQVGSAVASALSARRAEGDTPGLYGGTRDAGTCDVEQLVAFLTDDENADKAQAWADTLGIDVGDIEEFVADLTPVRLRFDTRVTNHGFVDGEANGFQSILEAGTTVLVDDEGVPRVKCNCGNPLAEPQDLDDAGVDEDDALDVEELAQNPDDAWDDFDPEDVVVVEPGDELEEFVLVDIDTGELFERPVGTDGEEDGDVDPDDLCEEFAESPTCSEGPDDTTTTTEGGDTTTTTDGTTTTVVLGTGDVQVTLEWFSNADLDLAVTDPTGERISFGNSGPTATGGELDIDSNVGCPAGARSGVENIFWPAGGAPGGSYTVEVSGFGVDTGTCGGGDYVLTIRVAGSADQVIQESVGDGESDTFNFTVG